MTRRLRDRGPPFVEVEGRLYLNLAFDLAPRGPDPRHEVAALLGCAPETLVVLRALDARQARTVTERRADADVEGWAVLVGTAARGR